MGKRAETDRRHLKSLRHSFTLDLVVGFQHRTDAERFLKEFRERLAKLGLELHADIVFFSGRRRHTRCYRDWSSDVCSSDLTASGGAYRNRLDVPRRVLLPLLAV